MKLCEQQIIKANGNRQHPLPARLPQRKRNRQADCAVRSDPGLPASGYCKHFTIHRTGIPAQPAGGALRRSLPCIPGLRPGHGHTGLLKPQRITGMSRRQGCGLPGRRTIKIKLVCPALAGGVTCIRLVRRRGFRHPAENFDHRLIRIITACGRAARLHGI